MSARPVFYKPVFGNDNFSMKADLVDISAFTNPAMKLEDAAVVQQIKKLAEAI